MDIIYYIIIFIIICLALYFNPNLFSNKVIFDPAIMHPAAI